MINQHQHTTEYKQRIPQFDDGEMPQIARIDGMRCDAQSCQGEGEPIHEPEESLYADDGVDETA